MLMATVAGMTTKGRSLMKAKFATVSGTVRIYNNCLWAQKLYGTSPMGMAAPYQLCLGVREPQISDKLTTVAISPKYLIWRQASTFDHCESFYVTSGFDNEKDMFDIFWQSPTNDKFYSPSCCYVSNDNVNTPIVDSGLTMCRCWASGIKRDINIIEGSPVLRKGWNLLKKWIH